MMSESEQIICVYLLGIISFSVFVFVMFVWIAERPKRIYNWIFEFSKRRKLGDDE